MVYGGQEIGLGGVRALVKRMTDQDPVPVIIQVDKNASAGIVVRVIDEAKLGGAKNVSLASEPGAA
ncbi:MAG: biopolymer transporter ExbD [Verrucomicrobia bacterium]|nr:biopolymer transporter ExbD [Verrucomicrobiota bacterium]